MGRQRLLQGPGWARVHSAQRHTAGPYSGCPRPRPRPRQVGVGAGLQSGHTDRASCPHAADAAGCSSPGRGGSVSRRPPGQVEICLVFTKLGAGLLMASTGWRTRTGNTQDRHPQGVTQPQTSREPRQRRTALGRDSRPDERGKPTIARRC